MCQKFLYLLIMGAKDDIVTNVSSTGADAGIYTGNLILRRLF